MFNGVILSRTLRRIRSSARAFARAPGLLAALLITIALGVGSNAATYGFLQGLTHPASPLGNSGRIVSVFRQDRFHEAGPLSADDYRLLQKSHGVFEWVGGVRVKPAETVIDGHSETFTIGAVTPDTALALSLSLDDGAVISRRLWKGEFGGRDDLAGSKIRIDNVDYKVGGIAPDGLDGIYSDRAVDFWIPLRAGDLEGDGAERRDLWVLGRLGKDVSAREAERAVRQGSAGLSEVSVVPFTGIAPNMARGLSRVGLLLDLFAGAVFLIATINVASLLLGRALRRSHETSLRIALGATRAGLMQDLFADSVVISVAGGALGLVLGIVTAHALPALLFEEDAERLRFATHLLPILVASLVCIGITVLCGMMPVAGTVTDRPWTVLQRETCSASKGIQRLRSGFVIGQIAICCIIVIFTTLLLAGLHTALETSVGHGLGDPVLLTVQAQVRPDGPEIDTRYFSEVEKRAQSIAGLTPLAWTSRVPGNQPTWRAFRVHRSPQRYRDVTMDIAWLTPETLKLLDDQPIAGRMFEPGDQGRLVAIADEDAAAEMFGDETAGMVILDAGGRPIKIVGVVKSKSSVSRPQKRPTIYYGFVNQPVAPSPIPNAKFRAPVNASAASIELSAHVVSADYFSALDMPLIAGNWFLKDRNPGRETVAVINQEAADLYFNAKPIGAGVIDDHGLRAEIIGVVGSQAFGTFQERAEPSIYFLMWQKCPPRMTLILKHAKWDKERAAGLQQAIEGVPGGSSNPVGINTLDAQLAQSGLAGLRIATLIGGASAVMALMLSMLGLLSAQSDAEHQRQRDRALQIALGAQRWRIVRLVVMDAGRLAFAGTVAGTLLSFALFRLVIADLSIIAAPPLQVWLIAPLLPAVMVTLASVIPGQRVSRISPLATMRDS